VEKLVKKRERERKKLGVSSGGERRKKNKKLKF
jgi:hypothetical protein